MQDVFLIIWRILKRISDDPSIRLVMFFGILGLLVMLIGTCGNVFLSDGEAWLILKNVCSWILTGALVPLAAGATQVFTKFMNGGPD